MEHEEARELLTAHVDGELRGREALDVARHVEGCAECAVESASLVALRRTVESTATRFRAPAALEHRVRAAVAPSSPGEAAASSAATRWRRLAAASAFATVVAVAWGIGLVLERPSANDLLAEEIVSSHVRSLLSYRTVDVASSDQHTVKPWFSGKVDYSPPVHDLTADGFPLEGGRVDYVDHRPVAALVYRRNQHTVNLYVLPALAGSEEAAPVAVSRQGFHLLRWVHRGMTYWAISDVEWPDLTLFRAALLARE